MVAISTNWRNARLRPADYAMLEFGEKLTVMPSAMVEGDLEMLRQAGFSDREIVSITAAAAYRNFITRVADGLGVELGQHGDSYYAPAVLRAFGVTEHAVGGSLYADREHSAAPGQPARNPAVHRPSITDDRRVCWIDVDAQAGEIAGHDNFGNLAAALSLKPDTLAATFEFARLVDHGGSVLGKRLEAIIGVTVAATAGLSYLGAHSAQHLLDAGATPRDLQRLIAEPNGGSLDGREREVARFCEQLTRAPGTIARADLERVRASGCDDSALVAMVAAAAFANYCGRVAAGLGVTPEASLSEPARGAI